MDWGSFLYSIAHSAVITTLYWGHALARSVPAVLRWMWGLGVALTIGSAGWAAVKAIQEASHERNRRQLAWQAAAKNGLMGAFFFFLVCTALTFTTDAPRQLELKQQRIMELGGLDDADIEIPKLTSEEKKETLEILDGLSQAGDRISASTYEVRQFIQLFEQQGAGDYERLTKAIVSEYNNLPSFAGPDVSSYAYAERSPAIAKVLSQIIEPQDKDVFFKYRQALSAAGPPYLAAMKAARMDTEDRDMEGVIESLIGTRVKALGDAADKAQVFIEKMKRRIKIIRSRLCPDNDCQSH
jgi:hypothetical protein